jgi:hypothetical protein
MARGREAARAAGRRAVEAQGLAAAKDAELAALRSEHKKEATALRDEIKRLRCDHMAEASKLATEEVGRRLAEIEEKQRDLGFSVDMGHNLLYQKDKFVRNACRYISMTKGLDPSTALEMVVTWMTDEDCMGLTDSAAFIVKLGVPSDGWVAMELRRVQHWNRTIAKKSIRSGKPRAVSLDHAEQEGNPNIHPEYKPHWYPPLTYREMHLVDDDGLPVEAAE